MIYSIKKNIIKMNENIYESVQQNHAMASLIFMQVWRLMGLHIAYTNIVMDVV